MKQPTLLLAAAAALLLSSTDAFSSGPRSSAPPSSHAAINTARQYAVAVPPVSPPSELEKRISKIVKVNKKKQAQEQREKAVYTSPDIQEVTTLQDYKQVVADEKEKMVVVRFYAPWCRACKSVAPTYKKFAKDYAGKNIKFVDAPMTAVNAEIHQGLGIKTLPFTHIYHPQAGLVEERRLGRKHYFNFEKVAKSYLEGSCDIKDDECKDPYPNFTVEEEAAASQKRRIPVLRK